MRADSTRRPSGQRAMRPRSAGDPVVGLAPAGVGVLAGVVGVRAGRRVRAEELHRALLGVQRPQRVGQQLVGDVAVGVDDEAVVAEPAVPWSAG